jgi:hypothetical protein
MAQDDPPWLQPCLDNIASIPGGVPCPSQTCADVASYTASVCGCQPPFQNGCSPAPTPGCCAYTPSSPVYVALATGGCVCCCGAGATWPADCQAEAARLGGALCAEATCSSSSVQSYLRGYCTCTPPYQGACQSAAQSCACVQASPAWINGDNCYCCCGTVMASTFTAVDGVRGKSAERFREGDPIYVAEDASLTRWTQRPVAFSAGAAATGIEVPVVRVRFRAGEDALDWVVADRNRPFLLADRTLRRAGALAEGDALVCGDGSPAPVVEVASVAPRIVHQLATTREPARGAGGHLLLVHGVVAGDYALQLADPNAVG